MEIVGTALQAEGVVSAEALSLPPAWQGQRTEGRPLWLASGRRWGGQREAHLEEREGAAQ